MGSKFKVSGSRFKGWVLLVALLVSVAGANAQDCTVKDIRLQGAVQVVDAFGDITVFVDPLPNTQALEVTLTDFVYDCGHWQIVESHADFTVEIVSDEAFADTVIRIIPNSKKAAFMEKYVR